MARKTYEEIADKPESKLKKLFYALRSAVACLWILDREDMPPIVFQHMLNKLDIDAAIKDRITDLITLKATKSESYFHPKENNLIDFISTCIYRAEQDSAALPPSKGNWKDLDSFFRNMLTGS